MLIFKQDKIACHLGENRLINGDDQDIWNPAHPWKDYRQYAVHFTLQVNWTLKDIRTVLWQDSKLEYLQDRFTTVVSALNDLWYYITDDELDVLYRQINYDTAIQWSID
jgi:hypothetical protein